MSDKYLDVLNYALTLEHLEDALYHDIVKAGILTGQAQAYAEEYAYHEHQHVVLLEKVIMDAGGTPVKRQPSYNWPKFKSEAEAISFLRTVEDVGVSAYIGQVTNLQGSPYLTAAVQIHSVESYHATAWRLVELKMGIESESYEYAVPFAFATYDNGGVRTKEQVLKIVSPLLSGMPNTGAGGMAGDDSRGLLSALGVGTAAAAVALATKKLTERRQES